MPKAVFMSYSHENADFVIRLRTDLQAHGVRVWIDHESLPPGTPDWDEAIRVALRTVDAVLFIASPESRKSRFVRDELNVAQMYQRTLYPIWAAGEHWIDCVPIGWGATQYVDARGASYATALDALLRALDSGAPASSAPSAPSDIAAPPVSPAKSVFDDLDELLRQSEASKQSAKAHAATPSPSNELSRLSDLLAANDWDGADAESQALLSAERGRQISSGLLVEMDDLWRAASGEGLRKRTWVTSFEYGGVSYTPVFQTWWERVLKAKGR